MLALLIIFSLFHLAAGVASLGLAVRMSTDEERGHWRSVTLLRIAQAICWVYPALSVGAGILAWRAFDAGAHEALPILLTPLLWLVAMGIVFAIVDYAEDGILGNARSAQGKD
jgi:hypothetical protein